jgi:hypothetical protein
LVDLTKNGGTKMNQPTKETKKLLLQLMKKTSLPVILEKQNEERKGA